MHSFLTDRHTQSRVYRPLLEAWMHPDGQFIFYQGSCSIEGEKKVRFLSVFHSFCLIPGWWQEEKLRNIESLLWLSCLYLGLSLKKGPKSAQCLSPLGRTLHYDLRSMSKPFLR